MRVFVSLIALAIFGFVFINALIPSAPNTPTQPVSVDNLQIPTHSLDFGVIWESDRFEHTMPVTNPGPTPAEVTAWTTSCGCLGVTPDRLTLKAI